MCICLVRLILEALISFMPTKGEGAIGALDFPPEERKRLAKQVRVLIPVADSLLLLLLCVC